MQQQSVESMAFVTRLRQWRLRRSNKFLLTPYTRGIGVKVVAKSATQLMIPHIMVATPSSKQVASETVISQYALTGVHRNTAMKGNDMKMARVYATLMCISHLNHDLPLSLTSR
jgi:hypothetical protein